MKTKRFRLIKARHNIDPTEHTEKRPFRPEKLSLVILPVTTDVT